MSDNPSEAERVIDFDGRDAALDEERGKEQALYNERHKRFLAGMLTDPAGRDWLWRLLNEFGTFAMAFGMTPTGFTNRDETIYQLGRKSCGERIWFELDNASPELASLMRREHS